jgi:glyoxylase-like metal-dependent hydrolase (beta-lactamase superfamily II)
VVNLFANGRRKLSGKKSFIALIALLLAVPALVLSARAAGQQVSGPPPAQPVPAEKSWPPAGCTANCDKWTPVKSIDFSSKHDVLIRSDDGTLTPMDVPYRKATLIAPGTWQIESDGDYQYLIEGDNEALAIDAGYGAGNIREFMQTLTKKPVRYVANTHHHFDHTANDAYFDRAFMSAYTQKWATIPFASFAGMSFPRNYPITVVSDGYVFHLGNRDVEVFDIPNHTMGDTAYLDKKSRILFGGDVFMQRININEQSSVARFAANLRKIVARRADFDRIAAGSGIMDASRADHLLAVAESILAGHEGDPVAAQQGGPGGPGGPGGQGGPGGAGGTQGAQQNQQSAPPGATVYRRRWPHSGDHGFDDQGSIPQEDQRRVTMDDVAITYDIRHVQN